MLSEQCLNWAYPLLPPGSPGIAPLLAFFAELARKLLTLPEVIKENMLSEAREIAGAMGASVLPVFQVLRTLPTWRG